MTENIAVIGHGTGAYFYLVYNLFSYDSVHSKSFDVDDSRGTVCKMCLKTVMTMFRLDLVRGPLRVLEGLLIKKINCRSNNTKRNCCLSIVLFESHNNRLEHRPRSESATSKRSSELSLSGKQNAPMKIEFESVW